MKGSRLQDIKRHSSGLRIILTTLIVVGVLLSGWSRHAQAQSGDPVAESLARLAVARGNLRDRVPGYGEDIRAVAAQLAALGHRGEAILALGELVNAPESPLDKVNARHMIAAYYSADGLHTESFQLYREMISAMNAEPNGTLRAWFSSQYAQAYSEMAHEAYLCGFALTGIKMTDKLLSAVPDNLSAELRQATLVNQMLYAKSIQMHDKVKSSAATLFSTWPNFGKVDGSAILLRVDQAIALGGGEGINSAGLEILIAAFDDADLSKMPQMTFLADPIATGLMAQGFNGEAMDVFAKTLGRLDSLRSKWVLENTLEFNAEWVDRTERELTSRLGSASQFGRPWLELWALLRNIQRADTPDDERARLLAQYSALRSAMLAQDESVPPNGLGVFADSNGVAHPELASVVSSAFNSVEQIPVQIMSAGPLRFRPDADWASGFFVYAGNDAMTEWTAVSPFIVRGPADPLNGKPRAVVLSRRTNAVVPPGVYAVVPKSSVRWDLGDSVPTNRCPTITWNDPLGTGPESMYGAYYFRVATDCDSDGVNDLLQISTGLASVPVVNLDADGDGILDSCEQGAVCRGDFNHDHVVSVQDIFDFLGAWFARCTSTSGDLQSNDPCRFGSADFNTSGAVSTQDIFDFLAAWFLPC